MYYVHDMSTSYSANTVPMVHYLLPLKKIKKIKKERERERSTQPPSYFTVYKNITSTKVIK
jgi:hypothetical protein